VGIDKSLVRQMRAYVCQRQPHWMCRIYGSATYFWVSYSVAEVHEAVDMEPRPPPHWHEMVSISLSEVTHLRCKDLRVDAHDGLHHG